jgi:Regulator of chromosome condensation (RCC1) repeat.
MARHPGRQIGFMAIIAGLLSGCQDSFESSSPHAHVRPNGDFPIPREMYRSQTVEAAVIVETNGGAPIDSLTITWGSSDANVLRIRRAETPNHVNVTAVGFGEAEITARVSAGIGRVEQTFLVDTIQVNERWVDLSVGRLSACGINQDSLAYCWNPLLPKPVQVPGLFGITARRIEFGHDTGCLLTTQFAVYCWGKNSMMELGAPGRHSAAIEVFGGDLIPSRIALGGSYLCLATNTGAFDQRFLECSGNSTFHQLGDPPDTTTCVFNFDAFHCGRHSVAVAADSISAGENHVCALDVGNLNQNPPRATCWGAAVTGQLGPRDATTLESCQVSGSVPPGVPCGGPALADASLEFNAVEAGWDIFTPNGQSELAPTWLGEGHTCGVALGGILYCWGKNNFGQLGAASDSTCRRAFVTSGLGLEETEVACRARPAPVDAPSPGTFESVALGSEHTCGVMTDQRIYCWGRNDTGQLGDGTTTSRMSPAPIASDRTFAAVRAGPDVTCGLTTAAGMILCWGGGLGSVPVPLDVPR